MTKSMFLYGIGGSFLGFGIICFQIAISNENPFTEFIKRELEFKMLIVASQICIGMFLMTLGLQQEWKDEH